MRVFVEALPPTLGRAMHRINRELRKRAPEGVEFVSSPGEADLQILDVIGTVSLRHLYLPDYVILQHCYLTTEQRDPQYWLPFLWEARLVMSYHDLYHLTGADDFPFYRSPWGVDGAVFRDSGLPRTCAVLTSGYDLSGEPIGECHDAAKAVGLPATHLGPALIRKDSFHAFNGVTDEKLSELYNRCPNVSGPRRGEGFELPVLEGLACGARPIFSDTAGYRYWFGDHAVYLAELPPEELTRALIDVSLRKPEPVEQEERKRVLERLDWSRIFDDFWLRVLEDNSSSVRL